MRRRELLKATGAGALALTLPRVAWGQPRDVPLVATLLGRNPPPDPIGTERSAGIEQGLAEEGWVVGDNIRIEHRFTEAQQALTTTFAAELLALSPDVFVTGTTVNSLAVQSLTRTIPIVFAIVTDPVGVGLVETYGRPGGNATGIAHTQPSVGGAYVDLLMEVAPDTSRVVYMVHPGDTAAALPMRPFAAEAAAKHGLAFEEVLIDAAHDIGPAIDTIATTPGAGIVIANAAWFSNRAALLIAATEPHFIPVVSSWQLVEGGGIACVDVDSTESFRRAGIYAGRILNGADPSTLPVRSPTYFIGINLRTAAVLGLEIPPSLIARADRIIE